jgi:sugar (pentulose or hexulose) kinase
MSLLGLDVGTTGCKAAVFSTDGRLLALAYAEYDYRSPEAGWAELDVQAMVRLERTFVPDPSRQERYRARFEEYRQLYTLLKGSLKAFHRADHLGAA